LTFFIVAVGVALFGFTDIAAGAAPIAKIIFFIFMVLIVTTLVANSVNGRRPPM